MPSHPPFAQPAQLFAGVDLPRNRPVAPRSALGRVGWLAALGLALGLGGAAHAVDVSVAGSSGKYFPTQPQACEAAQADAAGIARDTCARDGGEPGEPTLTDCTCEQGGFGGEEWLCNARATASCAPGAAPRPTPVAAPTGSLALDLPASSSPVELLAADFNRRGLTLPAAVRDARYRAACDGGWALACEAAAWHPRGAADLNLAAPLLDRACAQGDGAACIAHGWALEGQARSRGDAELYRAAARQYKARCDDANEAWACYEYGAILFNNLGVVTDPRLGVRRWETACADREPAACTALARVYAVGTSALKADRAKATEFARKACEAGDPLGCFELDQVKGASASALRARRVQTCQAGAVNVCWELASELLAGPPDPAIPLPALLELGCELGSGPACSHAGGAALQAGDDAKAAARFRQACAVDEVAGCVGVVDLLLAERAAGSLREDRYAYEVACSKGANAAACSALGLALLDGESAPRDPTRARSLLRQSCVDKSSPARSCFVLGDLYESGAGGDRDRTLSAQYYNWACGQGWGPACERRGDLLHGGVGVRRDDAGAVADYQSGCDAGSPTACYKAAVILDDGSIIKRDPVRARDLYQTACERSVGEACLRLGRLHVQGAAGGKDETAARAAFEKAVDLDNVEAHRHLARLLWHGLGGKRDKKRARQLCATGCRAADPIACRGPAWQTE